MPELPEAESIARALKRVLVGRTIQRVEIFSPRLRSSLSPLSEAALAGRTFTDVRRRGRFVVAALDDGRGIMMHFGMSGVVRVEDLAIPKRKHEHLFLVLDNEQAFRFEDTRRFGLVECHQLNEQGWPDALNYLGPEPLSDEFNAGSLYLAAQKHRGPVKVFLMDNAVVTGVGNIYATEALFQTGIHPARPANALTKRECAQLVDAIKAVLVRAIAAGGTTFSDFLNVDGSEGKFVQELNIYGKSGMPCPRCGGLLESVKLGGRTSVYCPKCQR